MLVAVSPSYALTLLATHPAVALTILGAVFLVLTGAEALYADMGHFGKTPVRLAWLGLRVAGAAAQLLRPGRAAADDRRRPIENPFFALAPRRPVAGAGRARHGRDVVASQATISGAFSVTRQAVQLDLLPRVEIRQTSADERGQIYVPAANVVDVPRRRRLRRRVRLLERAVGGVRRIGHRRHDHHDRARRRRRAQPVELATVARRSRCSGLFLVVDLAFLAGNVTKIAHGGWVPLTLAALMFAGFITWRDGRAKLRHELRERAVPWTELPKLLAEATRVPGTAVFLVSQSGFVPTAMLRNLEHNHVCHERIVILHLEILRMPRQDRAARAWVEELTPEVHAVHARFGFMETPDVAEALRGARQRGLRLDDDVNCTYFLGWHLVRARPRSGIAGHQVAGIRLSAAPQRAGRGVLPHADEARRRAGDRDRHLAAARSRTLG